MRSSGTGRLQPAMAPLADLQDGAVERFGAQIEVVWIDRLAVDLHRLPWRIRRRASLEEIPNSAAIRAGRCTSPSSVDLHGRRGDLVRQLAAHVHLVEALPRPPPRPPRRGSGR